MVEPLLTGIRVVDLTFWLPGPYCSRLLGDLGAEVVKVERRLMGDPMRLATPLVGGESSLFLALNRNKKSLALNLKRPPGREVLLRLAATADVLLEGNKPGQMDGLGLGYDALREVNPRLVYCSLSGFGQDGAYRDRSGHDITYGALAGLFDLLPPGANPILPGLQLADLAGGLFATIGVLAALVRRAGSGLGAYLDVNLLDSMVSLLSPSAAALLCGQLAQESIRLLAGHLPGYNLYRTQDGRWMALGALEPVFWGQFCRAIGREELAGQSFPAEEEREAVIAEVQRVFAGRTQSEWVAFFAGHDVCCEPVLSLEEGLARPELAQRGMVFYLQHPTAGRIGQVGSPIRSGAAGRPDTPPPLLGQQTVELLQELGYSAAQIADLRASKIVATPEDAAG